MATDETTTSADTPPADTPPADTAPPTPPTGTAPSDPVGAIGHQLSDAGQQMDKALGSMPPQTRFIIVVLLSIFVGGFAGSMMNGQVLKGVAILVGTAAFIFIGFFTLGLLWMILPLIHIGLAVDAILIGNRKLKGETFGDWDFCWKPVPKAV